MPDKMKVKLFVALLTRIFIGQFKIFGQQKSEYNNLQEAIFSGRQLSGKSGPGNVDWINGGKEYSYTARNDSTKHTEIRKFNPESLSDNLLLDVAELTFPGTDDKFNYTSFQWSQDSKYLIFQTNFRPIYRYSGISDYYVYSLGDKSLKLLVKDARTAQLSPDGTMVGYERNGNMYVYKIINAEEKQLTNDASETQYYGHFDWVYEEEFGMGKHGTGLPIVDLLRSGILMRVESRYFK